MKCQHRSVVGNSEGETCMDCREVLAGYGHEMQSRECKHHRAFNEGREPICMYCFREQPVEEET